MRRRDVGGAMPPLEVFIDTVQVEAGADAAAVARAVEARVRAELETRREGVQEGSSPLFAGGDVARAVTSALAGRMPPP